MTRVRKSKRGRRAFQRIMRFRWNTGWFEWTCAKWLGEWQVHLDGPARVEGWLWDGRFYVKEVSIDDIDGR